MIEGVLVPSVVVDVDRDISESGNFGREGVEASIVLPGQRTSATGTSLTTREMLTGALISARVKADNLGAKGEGHTAHVRRRHPSCVIRDLWRRMPKRVGVRLPRTEMEWQVVRPGITELIANGIM